MNQFSHKSISDGPIIRNSLSSGPNFPVKKKIPESTLFYLFLGHQFSEHLFSWTNFPTNQFSETNFLLNQFTGAVSRN